MHRFDHIEEARERNEGLAYEDSFGRLEPGFVWRRFEVPEGEPCARCGSRPRKPGSVMCPTCASAGPLTPDEAWRFEERLREDGHLPEDEREDEE